MPIRKAALQAAVRRYICNIVIPIDKNQSIASQLTGPVSAKLPRHDEAAQQHSTAQT